MSEIDKFERGFMVCLTVITSNGKDINTPSIEAWKALGEPTDKELKAAGVDSYDIKTAQRIREYCK